MTPELIIVDGNYLGHRARHTTGQLGVGDIRTGVTFGFLGSLLVIGERFRCNHFAFCWDSRHSERQAIYPAYKANRKPPSDPVEAESMTLARAEFKRLRRKVLPTIGFFNQFLVRGLEADDLIASICHDRLGEFLIVSADHDLYQLLSNSVSMYNPASGKLMTRRSFREEYGIEPHVWPRIKAIAGCSTDNIKGVGGVGIPSAIKAELGLLKRDSAKYKAVFGRQGVETATQNLPLVHLPFRHVELELVQEAWSSRFIGICHKYGFETFLREMERWERFFRGEWVEPTRDINERIRQRRSERHAVVNE